ncbi:MAG: DUF4232 domain-containing protein, partial [Propionibacterium sp.]|nr:DUF4232 domain-containing protein [Propionibacterium sp.]
EAVPVSDRPCTLLGTPGIGARGTVGSRLILDLENRDPIDPGPPVAVTLEPGAEAWTNIEWTGALAGRGQEHVRLLVVQLAPDDPPVAFFPPGENGGNPPNKDLQVADRYPWEDGGIIDLTAGTTVRIGPWRGEP